MASITIQLDDSKAKLLREKAERYGLRPEQLLALSIEDLVSKPDPAFDEAAKKVLSKNQELNL
jgi:hypothetical protein